MRKVSLILTLLIFSSQLILGQGVLIDKNSYTLTLHISGVYDATVTVIPFTGTNNVSPLCVLQNVRKDTVINFPDDMLPGEFDIRFDYRVNPTDKPSPSDMMFFMNRQNIEWKLNPQYIPDDSLVFLNDDENSVYRRFMQDEKHRWKQEIGLLEKVAVYYDHSRNTFYKKLIQEYNSRRKEYNAWIDEQTEQYGKLFASRLFQLQKVQTLPDENLDEQNLLTGHINHYFDDFNFSDTLVIRTRDIMTFMEDYMSLFGILVKQGKPRDSLYVAAGEQACTLASKGNPKVYGWMADYFYKGYEQASIEAGKQMLQKHINNPNCFTRERQLIANRVKGASLFQEGTAAPYFQAETNKQTIFDFATYRTAKKYCMLVFYDSQCLHCQQLLSGLKQLYAADSIQHDFDIISVSLDSEQQPWLNYSQASGFTWTDVWAKGGMLSKAANDYCVIGTPVVYMLNSDRKIVKLPQYVEQMIKKITGK